ncbi:hypothetical protein TCAL_15749, partial [Tigriopus californicus]
LGKPEVKFAGFSLSSKGYSISSEITEALTKFPTPSGISDVRSFFGLANQRHWAAYFPTDDTFARIDSKENTEKIIRLGSKEIQVAFDGVWFTGEIVEGFDSAVACDKFLNEPVPDLLDEPAPSTSSGKRGRAPFKDDRLVKIRLQEVATASEEHIPGTSSDMDESDDSSIQEGTHIAPRFL